MKLDYDEKVDDILVDWNEHYETFRRFYRERTLDKGTYLQRLDDLLGRASPMIERAATVLTAHEQDGLNEEELIQEMQRLGKDFRPLYLAAGELGSPPYEARELDEAFQNMMAHGDNLFLYFSPEGLEQWERKGRLYMAHKSLERALDESHRVRLLRGI